MGEAAGREDVEALARVIYCAANDTSTGSGLYASEADHLAERILASPWLAAYVAAAVEAARREGAGLHRDLVSRLGFGNNITEPMADNDTIVEWFEERGREADEWRESQRWRDECHLAGHPEDEDCLICDPLEVARREGAETALREAAREASRGPGWGPGLHGDPVPDLLAVSRWLRARADAAVETAKKPRGPGPWCHDCGLDYGGPGWCDTHVPNDIWERISPTGNGGGLLCLTCMTRRIQDAGIDNVPLEVMSGPWDYTTGTHHIRREAFEHGKRVGADEARADALRAATEADHTDQESRP